ncbi:hypothetical protein Syun_010144 [Stephania yunnanensis]|uniref:Uncharacterized protein n=1 Tax=Stephania yunnanensis TaxID=152371 RepID=A0AAP0KGZ0_9MAGN
MGARYVDARWRKKKRATLANFGSLCDHESQGRSTKAVQEEGMVLCVTSSVLGDVACYDWLKYIVGYSAYRAMRTSRQTVRHPITAKGREGEVDMEEDSGVGGDGEGDCYQRFIWWRGWTEEAHTVERADGRDSSKSMRRTKRMRRTDGGEVCGI